ncbi:hypothetical protein SAMN05428952_104312 [Nitrosomonas sp. Nm132]|nr:hypothetical protein SAMN05428952_104312 [Nitrosomonas sp. Nm132]SDY94671.1 hypothetical protein SAMN05421754_10347 [Nitrosomonas sp. Nm58]
MLDWYFKVMRAIEKEPTFGLLKLIPTLESPKATKIPHALKLQIYLSLFLAFYNVGKL